MKSQIRRICILSLGLAVLALLVPPAARAQRGALEGTLVDTEGNTVGKHVLVLEPLAGGSPIKIKTKASGKFWLSLPADFVKMKPFAKALVRADPSTALELAPALRLPTRAPLATA